MFMFRIYFLSFYTSNKNYDKQLLKVAATNVNAFYQTLFESVKRWRNSYTLPLSRTATDLQGNKFSRSQNVGVVFTAKVFSSLL